MYVRQEAVLSSPEWKQRLTDDPQQLEDLERTIHQAFARGADMLVAGIMATVFVDDEFQASSERTRREFSRPLERGRERAVAVRLLGGLNHPLLLAKEKAFRQGLCAASRTERHVGTVRIRQGRFPGTAKSGCPPSRTVPVDLLCPS